MMIEYTLSNLFEKTLEEISINEKSSEMNELDRVLFLDNRVCYDPISGCKVTTSQSCKQNHDFMRQNQEI